MCRFAMQNADTSAWADGRVSDKIISPIEKRYQKADCMSNSAYYITFREWFKLNVK